MAIERRGTSGGYLPLRDAIDRLFAESFITPSSMTTGFPPADLYVTNNDVILEMAIPGANPNNINVSATGDTVTVSGEIRHGQRHQSGQQSSSQAQGSQQSSGQQGSSQQSSSQQGQQPMFQEIWQGKFSRSFTLPVEVQPNKTEATFENGILTVKMPQSEANKPRKIQVKAGQSSSGQGQLQAEKVPVQSGSGS